MISIELTEEEARAQLEFNKRVLATIPPTDPNFDGIVDTYVALRGRIRTAKPVLVVKPKKGASPK